MLTPLKNHPTPREEELISIDESISISLFSPLETSLVLASVYKCQHSNRFIDHVNRTLLISSNFMGVSVGITDIPVGVSRSMFQLKQNQKGWILKEGKQRMQNDLFIQMSSCPSLSGGDS